MYQLKIGNIPLPKLYVCITKKEANKCRELGVPYIIKPEAWDDDKLIKAVLWRTLVKKFPHIKWDEVFDWYPRSTDAMVNVPDKEDAKRVVDPTKREDLGIDSASTDELMEVTENGEYRESAGGSDEEFDPVEYHTETISRYIGDLGWGVNIEELQSLKLLPVFLDDIAEAIKVNLMNTSWVDGYTKKLGLNLGSWQGSNQAPNLIVLDTSGSIPQGVAATMISLIDSLRHLANADLIITSRRSVYYPAHSELPSPNQLSNLIGGMNECRQFYAILREHILGRHWGNVIIFGDQDAPEAPRFRDDRDTWLKPKDLQATQIDNIICFHTYASLVPGYGLWAKLAAPKASITYNTDWCDYMDKRRW